LQRQVGKQENVEKKKKENEKKEKKKKRKEKEKKKTRKSFRGPRQQNLWLLLLYISKTEL
jgi:hypothetical protein